LRYAAAHGWRANDNSADARMLRHAGLPALPGGRRQPSLPWARLPLFMTTLDKMPGLAQGLMRRKGNRCGRRRQTGSWTNSRSTERCSRVSRRTGR
jgi:hypothetical protein